jgi:hypothetical protein
LAALSWPVPQPGLVIRYSYLWRREFLLGQEEGLKDRPCAVVVTHLDENGVTRVLALPITHSPPIANEPAIEIPAPVMTRLNLDAERSWIVLSEANIFAWPGPDLRILSGKGPESAAYGFLPPAFFRVVRDRFLAVNREGKSSLVRRTE